MDTTLAYMIVALVFAGVVVYAITHYGRIKSEVTTPFGGLKIEGSNPNDETARVAPSAPPSMGGVRVRDADVGGDATLRDRTGKGADVERIKTGGDLDVSSETPYERPQPKSVTPGGGSGVAVTMQDVDADRDVTVDASVTYVLPPEPAVSALHQIATPPADFTGRADELADLRATFRATVTQGRVIFGLFGMGGVGKTALARRLAQELKETYKDAQLQVNLRGSQPTPLPVTEAMALVIHAYRLNLKLPDNETEVGNLYQSVLSDKRALILLDDAAGAEQVEPLLPPGGCGVLVTSRKRFHIPGLHGLDLDSLPMTDASDLLRKIAPNRGLDASLSPECLKLLRDAGVSCKLEGLRCAEVLAQLCGRLPRALVNAGAALKKRVDLTAATYAALLVDASKRLALTEVDATFEVSFNLLPENLRLLWTMLAVFPDDFDLASTVAVWRATDRDAAGEAMSELVAYSLVDWLRGEGRYRLHDLARLYAAFRLSPADRAAAEERHAEYYEQLAEDANARYYQGGENVMRGLALFDRELVNIRAGQAWAAAHAITSEAAARLCSGYSSRAWFCVDLRLSASEQVRWFEEALAAARRLHDRKEEAVHLGNLGIVHENLGEIQAAIDFYERQLALTVDTGDRRGEAQALIGVGTANLSLGNAHRAVEYFEQALAPFHEIDDRQGEALVLGNLGLAYAALGEFHTAVGLHEKALAMHREMGDRRNEAVALHCLASVHGNLNETHLAISLYEQALAVTSEIGDHRGEAAARGGLGRSYADLDELDRAVKLYEQQLKIARDIGDREEEGRALFNESLALDGLGERMRAVPLAAGALQIFEAIEDPSAEDVRRQLAEWCGESGE